MTSQRNLIATAPQENGFGLIVVILAIFAILLVLGAAAPIVARDLRREREIEAVHRGNEYVRAVRLYYRKFGRYPASVDQLEKTNNIRFLRKKYDDPMTGKPDWRLILVGQNKTTVKGLFGQPLAGIPTGGLGGSGISGTSTPGTAIGGTGAGSILGGGPSTGVGGSTGSASGSSGSTSGALGGGIGSQSATTFGGSGGPFMGVGSAKSGESIITLNEQNDYGSWEFIYDPRIEQLLSRASLFGGGSATSATSTSLSGFGSSSGAPASPATTPSSGGNSPAQPSPGP